MGFAQTERKGAIAATTIKDLSMSFIMTKTYGSTFIASVAPCLS